VVQTGAGPDRGFFVLPEVGDEVLVGFEFGDFDSPYVLGGLWNGKDNPPALSTDAVDATSGEIAARAIVTRKGHRLEFVEDKGITLASGDGSVVITLDAKNDNIQITSGKTIQMKANNGISFDAGTGTLEFKGQKLSLTSTTDYELNATGQLKFTGAAGVSIEGPTIAIAGQAETKVTSDGVLTVRGSVVNIN
jgi:uncharacterized protein involved in type VI secretion and phage assembly